MSVTFAESLVTLNEHMSSLLSRVHWMCHAVPQCVRQLHRDYPQVGNEKRVLEDVKLLLKKFPLSHINRSKLLENSTSSYGAASGGVSQLKQHLVLWQAEVLRSWKVHYDTLVDIVETRDQVIGLCGLMDSAQVHLDLFCHWQLTQHFLDLVANYFALVVITSTFLEHRNLILVLYSLEHKMQYKEVEKRFPRCAQILSTFEQPLKLLHNDMRPHERLVREALRSTAIVAGVAQRFSTSPTSSQFQNLVSDWHSTPQTDSLLGELLLSSETLERWFVFGSIMIHHSLEPQDWTVLNEVMQNGLLVPLYREYSLLTSASMATIVGHQTVKKVYRLMKAKATSWHRHRCERLREELQNALVTFKDEPATVGPQTVSALVLLRQTRDEVLWWLRHATSVPDMVNQQKTRLTVFCPPETSMSTYLNKKWCTSFHPVSSLELEQVTLGELVFLMENLRQLLLHPRWLNIVNTFHTRMMHSYMTPAMRQTLKILPQSSLPEGVWKAFSELITKMEKRGLIVSEIMDIRMEWLQFQCTLAMWRGTEDLRLRQLCGRVSASLLHLQMTTVHHFQEDLVNPLTDLSLFYFHQDFLGRQFQLHLSSPLHRRFVMAFPEICSTHFLLLTRNICPEEVTEMESARRQLGRETFFRAIAEEIVQRVETFCGNTRDNRRLLQRQRRQSPLNKRKTKKELSKFPSLDSPSDTAHELCELFWSMETMQDLGTNQEEIQWRQDWLQCRLEKMLFALVNRTPSLSLQPFLSPQSRLIEIRAYLDAVRQVESMWPSGMSMISMYCRVLCRSRHPAPAVTLGSTYVSFYRGSFLSAAFCGDLIFSPIRRGFTINPCLDAPEVVKEGDPCSAMRMEQLGSWNQFRALSVILGSVGMQHLHEGVFQRIREEFLDVVALVRQHLDALLEMRQIWRGLRQNPLIPMTESNCSPAMGVEEVALVLLHMKNIGLCLAFSGLCEDAAAWEEQKMSPFQNPIIVLTNPTTDPPDSEQSSTRPPYATFLKCSLQSVFHSLHGHPQECKDFLEALLSCLVSSLQLCHHENVSSNLHCLALSIPFVLDTLHAANKVSPERVHRAMLHFIRLVAVNTLQQELAIPPHPEHGVSTQLAWRSVHHQLLQDIFHNLPGVRDADVERIFPHRLTVAHHIAAPNDSR